STRESFFRIQKYGNDESTYKLVHYESDSVIKVKFREVDTSTENVFSKGLRMFPTF
ncbi:unnamed protein product, partial [Brassica rapa subsp. narinosa]